MYRRGMLRSTCNMAGLLHAAVAGPSSGTLLEYDVWPPSLRAKVALLGHKRVRSPVGCLRPNEVAEQGPVAPQRRGRVRATNMLM